MSIDRHTRQIYSTGIKHWKCQLSTKGKTIGHFTAGQGWPWRSGGHAEIKKKGAREWHQKGREREREKIGKNESRAETVSAGVSIKNKQGRLSFHWLTHQLFSFSASSSV